MEDQTAPNELTRNMMAVALLIFEGVHVSLGRRSGWTQRAAARDRHSRPVNYRDPRAVRWCLAAAILRSGEELREREAPLGSGVAMTACIYEAFSVGLEMLAGELGITVRWWSPDEAVSKEPHASRPEASLEKAVVALNDARGRTRYAHILNSVEQSIVALTPFRSKVDLTMLLTAIADHPEKSG